MRFLKKVFYFASIVTISLTISPNSAVAQGRMGSQFHGLDQNDDGMISRNEWPGNSDRSFNNQDWNRDGILSGDELEGKDRWNDNDRNWNNDRDWNNRGQERRFSSDASRSERFQKLDYNRDSVISSEEWRNSNRSFEVLDRNNNKQIDRDEFFNREQVPVAVFTELDVNNDKLVSRSEWRASTEDFNRLNVNGDENLSEDEFYSRQTGGNSMADQIFQMILGNQ